MAHGQWDARAQVEAAEPMPVAVSLNLLLDRLSRLTRDQEQRQRVDRSAHELALALRRLRNGEGYLPPAYTEDRSTRFSWSWVYCGTRDQNRER